MKKHDFWPEFMELLMILLASGIIGKAVGAFLKPRPELPARCHCQSCRFFRSAVKFLLFLLALTVTLAVSKFIWRVC
jgi:hypothetical protein